MRMRHDDGQRGGGRRRVLGLATVYALILLMFVGLATMTLGIWFAAEVRRTKDARITVQERQLLLAGTTMVQARLATGQFRGAEKTVIVFPLPETLPGAKLAARLESVEERGLKVRIEVQVGGKKAAQLLTLVREGGEWRLAGSELMQGG